MHGDERQRGACGLHAQATPTPNPNPNPDPNPNPNQVRAGCTPKFKDVDTLCSMLTYSDGSPHLVRPEPVGEGCHRYADFPAEEFMVDRVSLEQGGAAVLPPMPGVSIIILCSGAVAIEERAENHDTPGSDSHGDCAPWGVDSAAAHVAEKGAVFMVSPDTALRLEARGGAALAFRACAKDSGMVASYRRAAAEAEAAKLGRAPPPPPAALPFQPSASFP